MLIRTWQKDYDLCDITRLSAGEYHKVKPGLYHQFECLESGVAYELYWAEFNHHDIVRETQGYMDEDETMATEDTITISTIYDETELAFEEEGRPVTFTIDRDNDGPYVKVED